MNMFDIPLTIQFDRKASDILGGDYWRVMKSFRAYIPASFLANEWTAYDKDCWIFVPSGTLTDLGTIPQIARAIENRDGRAAQAFVTHDQACEYLSATYRGQPQPITRREADLILRAGLIDCGLPMSDVNIIYGAVSAYTWVNRITEPSTYALKRRLEAEFNFEGLE